MRTVDTIFPIYVDINDVCVYRENFIGSHMQARKRFNEIKNEMCKLGMTPWETVTKQYYYGDGTEWLMFDNDNYDDICLSMSVEHCNWQQDKESKIVTFYDMSGKVYHYDNEGEALQALRCSPDLCFDNLFPAPHA